MFHFESDSSEMDEIDKIIRLTGLKFQNNKRVIGKRHGDLIVALGAFDISRNCIGNQALVAARLCMFYEAILEVNKNRSDLNIGDDFFYEQAIKEVSKKCHGIAKYLSPSTLRHVIEIYLLAFHRSGLKPVKPNASNTKAEHEAPPVQHGAAQPSDNGEAFIGEHLMDPSEPADHKSARIKLENLVKGWMVVRAIERRKKTDAGKPKNMDAPYPERQPGERNKAYILRLQQEYEDMLERRDMFEKERDREMDSSYELQEDYNRLLREGIQWRKEKDELEVKNFVSIDRMHNTVDGLHTIIARQNTQADLMQATIDRQSDQIDELKRRLGVEGDRQASIYERPDHHGRFVGGGGGRGGFTGFHGF